MRLLLLLVCAALLSGCASQECYTFADVDVAYTYGYQVGRASLLRCPECPRCPERHSEAAKEAARLTNEALADELEELKGDMEAEWGQIKALYR